MSWGNANRLPKTSEVSEDFGSLELTGHALGTAVRSAVKESTMNRAALWQRYQRYYCRVPSLGLALDISRMRFDDRFLEQMAPRMRHAFEAMDALERGAIANPDEQDRKSVV